MLRHCPQKKTWDYGKYAGLSRGFTNPWIKSALMNVLADVNYMKRVGTTFYVVHVAKKIWNKIKLQFILEGSL